MVGTSKFDVMTADDTFATVATGVMNFKRITRYVFVTDATHFIVAPVTKWTNAMIAAR